MNSLNDSVIICEPPRLSGKHSRAQNKERTRGVKRTLYESPLKHIQQSNKRFRASNNNKESENTERYKKVGADKNIVSLQDSVIVLSDTENEKNEQNSASHYKATKKYVKTKERGSSVQNRLLRRMQGSQNINQSLKNSGICVAEQNKKNSKNQKRKNVELRNNNQSSALISDIEELDNTIMTIEIDEEGTELSANPKKNKGGDDITVVWSSMKTPATEENNKSTEELHKEECDTCLGHSDRLFMIDCSPNKDNLECLNSEANHSTSINTKEDRGALPFSQSGLVLPKTRKKVYPKMKTPDTSRLNFAKMFAKSISGFSITQNVEKSTAQTSSSGLTPDVATITILDATPSSSTESATNAVTCNVFPSVATVQNATKREGLREIVIDGNNVAMSHMSGRVFSEIGLKLVIDYFLQRGHKVKAFVPQYRRSVNHQLLEKLHLDGTVIFTPSRYLGGRKITPYDDRFILQYATMCDGVVVSSDQYRDLYMEKPEWRNTIMNRLLAPTFVGDYVMFPEDPLGRNGPRLDEFLRH